MRVTKFDRENEEVLSLVSRNYAKARKESIEQKRNDAREERRQLYLTRKKSKAKDLQKNVIIAIVATATILGVGSKVVKEAKNTIDARELKQELSEHVEDNIKYTNTLNTDGNGYTWYYDNLKEIAQETLDENKYVDIHTRIYTTYLGLKDYEKDIVMNEIMEDISKIVQEHPEKYTDEEIDVSKYQSFEDYYTSLKGSKEEYINFMDDLIRAYATKDVTSINELLAQLNGGSR